MADQGQSNRRRKWKPGSLLRRGHRNNRTRACGGCPPRKRNAYALGSEAVRSGTWEWKLAENSIQLSDPVWSLFGLEKPKDWQSSFEGWMAIMHPANRDARAVHEALALGKSIRRRDLGRERTAVQRSPLLFQEVAQRDALSPPPRPRSDRRTRPQAVSSAGDSSKLSESHGRQVRSGFMS
jgi:hypothetical protein